jgi:hypothetical protein
MSPAAKLWEKTTAKRDGYMIGRMGSVRVLVLENNRRESDADNTHTLMFAEAPPYDGTRSQATPAEPSHSTPAPAHRRARRGGKTQQIDDDPVPF